MSQESKEYKSKLNSFLETITKSIVEYIECDINKDPQFDLKSLPFNFIYCYSISLITSEGNFTIITSQTSDALDTFWVIPMKDNTKSDNRIEINSKLKGFEIHEIKSIKFPFKLVLQFQNMTLFLYAAEIYETWTSAYDYKINDEMILLFQNEEDAKKFETMLNYG